MSKLSRRGIRKNSQKREFGKVREIQRSHEDCQREVGMSRTRDGRVERESRRGIRKDSQEKGIWGGKGKTEE